MNEEEKGLTEEQRTHLDRLSPFFADGASGVERAYRHMVRYLRPRGFLAKGAGPLTVPVQEDGTPVVLPHAGSVHATLPGLKVSGTIERTDDPKGT